MNSIRCFHISLRAAPNYLLSIIPIQLISILHLPCNISCNESKQSTYLFWIKVLMVFDSTKFTVTKVKFTALLFQVKIGNTIYFPEGTQCEQRLPMWIVLTIICFTQYNKKSLYDKQVWWLVLLLSIGHSRLLRPLILRRDGWALS